MLDLAGSAVGAASMGISAGGNAYGQALVEGIFQKGGGGIRRTGGRVGSRFGEGSGRYSGD